MSSLGGRLREMGAYENLDHTESKVNLEGKNPLLPIEKFPSLVPLRNAIMLKHLSIQFKPVQICAN